MGRGARAGRRREVAGFVLWERAVEPLAPRALLGARAAEPARLRVRPRRGAGGQRRSTWARTRGWTVCSLGPLALRTETVAAAVLGAVRVWAGWAEPSGEALGQRRPGGLGDLEQRLQIVRASRAAARWGSTCRSPSDFTADRSASDGPDVHHRGATEARLRDGPVGAGSGSESAAPDSPAVQRPDRTRHSSSARAARAARPSR